MIVANNITNLVMMLFVAYLIHPSFCVKWIPSYAGPYKFIWKKALNLTDDEAGSRQLRIQGYVTSFRHGHPQYGTGRVVNLIPLGDDFRVSVNVATWSNNQWKQNAFVMKFPRLCSDFTRYAPAVKRVMFEDDGKKCPIPAGDHTLKNKTIDVVIPDIPIAPYGHWLATGLVLDKKGKSIGGVWKRFTVPAFAYDVENHTKTIVRTADS